MKWKMPLNQNSSTRESVKRRLCSAASASALFVCELRAFVGDFGAGSEERGSDCRWEKNKGRPSVQNQSGRVSRNARPEQ